MLNIGSVPLSTLFNLIVSVSSEDSGKTEQMRRLVCSYTGQ